MEPTPEAAAAASALDIPTVPRPGAPPPPGVALVQDFRFRFYRAVELDRGSPPCNVSLSLELEENPGGPASMTIRWVKKGVDPSRPPRNGTIQAQLSGPEDLSPYHNALQSVLEGLAPPETVFVTDAGEPATGDLPPKLSELWPHFMDKATAFVHQAQRAWSLDIDEQPREEPAS